MRASRRGAQRFVVCAGAAAIAWGASLIEGCGAADCAETATCADPADGPAELSGDGAAGADGRVDSSEQVDATADSPPDGIFALDSAADSSSEAVAPSDGGAESAPALPDACVQRGNTEDCSNGIDDDCNGAIDCADPKCQGLGFHCVPQWPGGGAWTAPVVLYDMTVPGGPAPTAPGCTAYYPSDIMDGHSVPIAGAASCSCSCGAIRDAGCTGPYVSVWTSPGCSGTTYSAPISPDGGCSVVESTQDGINSGQIVDAGATTGSCAPLLDGSVPPWNPAASGGWAETGRVCAPSARTYFAGAAGGCGAGLVCVEPAPATFNGGKACLFSSGQVACPGGYATQYTYFDGGTDSRGCTDGCSCGALVGAQCQSTVNLFSNGDCTGTAHGIAASCTNSTGGSIGSNNRVSATASSAIAGGQCTPSSGSTAPTGKVIASTGAVTVCCQP